MVRGTVFDIQKFCVHDGPGIRTTVFLKGCPLRCLWCHNPESWDARPQILFASGKCVGCGACVAACPRKCHELRDGAHVFDRTRCTGCGACANACIYDALELCGALRSAEEVIAEVLKDKAFYETSGGGVTLSGGEPLFFWEWAAELFRRFKAAGLHTCLDTSLYAPAAAIEALLPVVDLWLPDYKADDEALHVRCTGVSNAVVRRNLERLVAAKARLEVRCLAVPGLADGADLAARHRYLASLGIGGRQVVDLEYHAYARSKYLALGMEDTMPPERGER